MVFDEIMPQALSLMTDVFGNYVIQKVIFLKLFHLLFSSSLYCCFLFCRNTWGSAGDEIAWIKFVYG